MVLVIPWHLFLKHSKS